MDLPRILPLDNEGRILTLMCDGLKTLGITDQYLGLARHQRRHAQVVAEFASSTTFSTAAANSEQYPHQSNSASLYQQLSHSLFC